MADPQPLPAAVLAAAIRDRAPGLAALLSGPNAGIATAALGRALLNDGQASIDDITAAASKGTDEVRLDLVAAEQDCYLRLRDSAASPAALSQDVALKLIDSNTMSEAASYRDLADARKRQVESHDFTNQVLAYVVTAGFFALILIMLARGVPADANARDIVFAMLGVVGTGWANIIGFYFGSSAGSKQKSLAINSALIRAGTTPVRNLPAAPESAVTPTSPPR